jgi:hypothetical protein
LKPDARVLSTRQVTTSVSGHGGPDRTRRFPLPEAGGGGGRQSVTRLPRHHDDLPAVMPFVRDEIGQDVRDVE